MTAIKTWTRVAGYFFISSFHFQCRRLRPQLRLLSRLYRFRSRNRQRRVRIECNELAGKRNDHAELLPRNGIDSLGIGERRSLELKLAADLRQLFLLFLRFLNPVSVLNPLVVLPAVSEKTEQEHRSQRSHDDVITIALRIGLAYDV